MISAFCTINDKSIICIEEPEAHLHPVLQRKLIRYLDENTESQYFIATHSASFIDTLGAAIFHVENDGEQTYVKNAKLKREKFDLCAQLGYRASDLVQSNMVVWVEGPSDRIYLKHWISYIDADLVEGIHYAIMFYGGRLLSHLSADDEEVDEFISLRSLNQNIAIIIDSDKASPNSHLNKTKKRIRSEIEQRGGIAWVTKGREIENYIPTEDLQNIIQDLYPINYIGPASGEQYDHVLYYKRRGKNKRSEIVKTVDKVKVAREVCKSTPDFSILDLRKRMEELVTLIRKAND